DVGFAAYFWFRRDRNQAIIWIAVTGVFLLHMLAYLTPLGAHLLLPLGFRNFTTRLMGAWGGQAGPILYTGLSVVGFVLFLMFRRTLTQPFVAWSILNIALLLAGWSMTDPNFRLIVTKEDNVPIVMLVFSVGFFTWLAFRRAVLN